MQIHSYSPYWLSHSTKQQYVVILSVLMINISPVLRRPPGSDIMYVLFACSSEIESCMQLLQKCTMNVRLAVIHSKKTCSKSVTTLAWITGLTETMAVRGLLDIGMSLNIFY